MNNYTLIAGVNGTGKSSLRGVLEGQGAPLGHIIESLRKTIPLCDKVVFYDNENGFVKASEIINNKFNYTNGIRPQ